MSDPIRTEGGVRIEDPDASPAPDRLSLPRVAAFGATLTAPRRDGPTPPDLEAPGEPPGPPAEATRPAPAPEAGPPTPAAEARPKRRRASTTRSPAPAQQRSLEERLRRRPPVPAQPMSERARFLLATLCGLVLAAGIHLAMVLALPTLSNQDAFSRLRGTMEAETAVLVAGTGTAETWMPLHDPAAAVGACAYDLTDGPVRISARTGSLVQSISFHTRGGVFYAVTDRAAVRGQLDLVVMTRRQLDEALASEEQDAPSRDVRVVSPRREGFMIVRAVAPSPSLRPQAEEAVRSVACVAEGEGGMAEPPPATPAPPAAPAPPPAARPATPPGQAPPQAPARPGPGQPPAR